jgi:hypothetical protein
MTRFARDAELRCGRIHLLRRDWLRPERRVEGGPAEGCVAGDADAVPRARFENRGLPRRMHHRRAARNPAPLVDQPDRRELTECAPLSRCVPIDLLIVRSRGQHYLAFLCDAPIPAMIPALIPAPILSPHSDPGLPRRSARARRRAKAGQGRRTPPTTRRVACSSAIAPASTRTPSKLAATDCGVAACVIVRW